MQSVYAMVSFVGGCLIGLIVSIPSWVVMMSIMAFFGDTYQTGNWLGGLMIVPVFTLIGGFIGARSAQKFYERETQKIAASSIVEGVRFRKLENGTHKIVEGPYTGEEFPSQVDMLNFVLKMRR